MRKLSLLTAITAFTLIVPFSFAQTAEIEDLELNERRPPAEFKGSVRANPIALFYAGLDTNRDKRVSRAELDAGIMTDWRALKPSVTGKVGAFKMEDWALETLGSREAYPTRLSFDSNLDNQVSQEEFTSRLTRTFNKMDADANGILTREELIFTAAPRIVRKEAKRDSIRQERPQRQPRGR